MLGCVGVMLCCCVVVLLCVCVGVMWGGWEFGLCWCAVVLLCRRTFLRLVCTEDAAGAVRATELGARATVCYLLRVCLIDTLRAAR